MIESSAWLTGLDLNIYMYVVTSGVREDASHQTNGSAITKIVNTARQPHDTKRTPHRRPTCANKAQIATLCQVRRSLRQPLINHFPRVPLL